jgi:hypothetical protein
MTTVYSSTSPVDNDTEAVRVYDATRRAGERQVGSTAGSDHIAIAGEWAISDAIDLSDNASTTVYDGPALLGGIWVEVTLGTAAATIDDNATARMTVPLAIPIGMHNTLGIIFETSLVVNPADTTTGTIRVLYRPLDPLASWAY